MEGSELKRKIWILQTKAQTPKKGGKNSIQKPNPSAGFRKVQTQTNGVGGASQKKTSKGRG